MYSETLLDYDLKGAYSNSDALIIYNRILFINKCTRNMLVYRWMLAYNLDPNGINKNNTINFMLNKKSYDFSRDLFTRIQLVKLFKEDLGSQE